MGLNPFRETRGASAAGPAQHRRSPADYVLVVAAVVVCIALVAWAFLG